MEPLSFFWQILALLAIGGLLLIVIFAIIEPGPLVKKRPFARRHRSAQANAGRMDSTDRNEEERAPDSDREPDK